MNGYVAQRRGRFYVVIYEGRDAVTGKERRTWHPAGTDRAEAERLAKTLAAKENKRIGAVRSLTFGAYLTSQWLPAKKLHLATSTYRGYERNVHLNIIPTLGRISIRRLRYQQLDSLYESLRHPNEGKGLSPKSIYGIHLIIRGALADAQRRGLVASNVALLARTPKQRSLQKVEGTALTAEELRLLMRTAAGHRFFPVIWLTAMTGMRRNEVLGLKWPDIDFNKRRIHLNRGIIAVGYEVHQTRGKTKTARRPIELDVTTMTALEGWASIPGRRVRGSRHRQRRTVGVHQWRRQHRASPRRLRSLPADREQRRSSHSAVSRFAAHPRQPSHQRGHPRKGRVRTARPRQHRPHDADLSTRHARHASRRRRHHRTPRPPQANHREVGIEEDPGITQEGRSEEHHETGTEDAGGTSWEQPEERRLNRRNAPSTTKAQVTDLGFRHVLGGGGRI